MNSLRNESIFIEGFGGTVHTREFNQRDAAKAIGKHVGPSNSIVGHPSNFTTLSLLLYLLLFGVSAYVTKLQ